MFVSLESLIEDCYADFGRAATDDALWLLVDDGTLGWPKGPQNGRLVNRDEAELIRTTADAFSWS